MKTDTQLIDSFVDGTAYVRPGLQIKENMDILHEDFVKVLHYTDFNRVDIMATYLKYMYAADTLRFDSLIKFNTNRLTLYDNILYNDPENTNAAHTYTEEHLQRNRYDTDEKAHLVSKSIWLGTRTNNSLLFFLNYNIDTFVNFLSKNKNIISKDYLLHAMLLYSFDACTPFSKQSTENINSITTRLKPKLDEIAIDLYGSRADTIVNTAKTIGICSDLAYWKSSFLELEQAAPLPELGF